MLNDAEIKSRDWHDPLNETYGWMFGGWGFFECQSGWRFIIEDMLRGLDAKLTGDERESFHISQVKEKYGTLSVYHNGPSSIERIVDVAEAASARTCDVCGGRGKLRGKGWISTRCDRHDGWRG